MLNIKFNYLYRDAGNYKLYGSVIFSNPNNLSLAEVESKIRARLIDGEFFNPDKWSIPRLAFEEHDRELDHDWHEFESVELTNESAITNVPFLSNALAS